MLNLVLMVLYYLIVLCPYYTIVMLLPYYIYLKFQQSQAQRERFLLKHYVIKAMPSIPFSKELFDDSLIECAICLESFKENEDYVTPLNCDKHFYHSDCIEEWLSNENFCPLCKKIQTPKSMRAFSLKFETRQSPMKQSVKKE